MDSMGIDARIRELEDGFRDLMDAAVRDLREMANKVSLLQAQLDESRRVIDSMPMSLIKALQPPSVDRDIVVIDRPIAPTEATPPPAKNWAAKNIKERQCLMCPAKMMGGPNRKYCDECNIKRAREAILRRLNPAPDRGVADDVLAVAGAGGPATV